MTDDELMVMEHLWKRGVPTRKIAEHLGYTQSNVLVTAFRYRDRFPKRQGMKHDQDTRELWVARIRAGRYTIEQAAEKLDVHPETIRRWLKGKY